MYESFLNSQKIKIPRMKNSSSPPHSFFNISHINLQQCICEKKLVSDRLLLYEVNHFTEHHSKTLIIVRDWKEKKKL